MDNDSRSSEMLPWVIGGIAVLALCMCLFLVIVAAGGAVFFGVRSTSPVPPPPITSVQSTPTPSSGTGSTPSDNPTPIPDLNIDSALLTVLDETVLPSRDLCELAIRLNNVSVDSCDLPDRDYSVGDVEDFFVTNSSAGTSRIDAELVYAVETDVANVYAWVEDGVRFNQNDLERSIDEFALETVPVSLALFGGDTYPGPGVTPDFHILHNSVMDPGTAGYYSSDSEYPREIAEFSNEKSMFMINISNTPPGDLWYNSVLAHEFQHLVHWHVDLNEESWINEGLSELSAYVTGFGPSDASIDFIQNPDIQLNSWPEFDSSFPYYGGGFLFSAYFLERFGEEGIALLVANPLNGMEAVTDTLEQLGEDMTAEDFFADWIIANYLNDPSAGSIYSYSEISAEYDSRITLSTPDLYQRFTGSSYPVENRGETVNQYGTNYIRLGGTGEVTLSFDGAEAVPIIDTDTHETDGDASTDDRFVWWSNRGDESNSHLTHRFDLTNVSSATLEYDLWFFIEELWDYGYLMISTDEGATWTIIETPFTTDDDPFGNSYGHGYTGQSTSFGSSNGAGWVHESIDLSPYTGGEVLIRWEMVTDDAVNQFGFAIDNIRIDAN